MPGAIPFIAAVLAPAGTAFTIGGIAVSYSALAAAGASLLVGSYQASKARRAARAAYDASFQDRTLTIRSAVAPRTLVLGTVRVGGALMYADTVGPNNAWLDQVLAVAGAQCESFRGVYFNEDYVDASDIVGERPTVGKYSTSKTLRGNEAKVLSGATSFTVDHEPLSLGGITISLDRGFEEVPAYITPTSFVGTTINIPATTGTIYVQYDYAGGPSPLRVQAALGSAAQAATAWSGVTTPKWGVDHRLRGIANIRTLFEWNENAYGSGAPSVEPVMRGPYNVWDPRTSTYLTHTSNPALLARWFMVLPRISGGCGIPESWIDDASVIEAANVCDELISVKKFDGSGYETVKRYECNTLLSVEAAPLDNLDLIIASMAGDRAFTAGKYRIVAGAFRAATVTITDADVYAGDAIDVGSYAARQVLPNMATGTFRDARRHWVETGAAPVVNSTYVAADGYGEEPVDVTLAATTDERQANYLMGVALELARGGAEIGITVKGIGANIRLLQNVQLDLTHYGAYAGMTFTVVRYRDDFNGRYRLLLRQTRATTYALDADRYTPVDQPVPADLSHLWNVDDMTGLAADLGAPTVQPDGTIAASLVLSWDLHSQEYVRQSGRIEIKYRRVDQSEWATVAPAQGGDTSASFPVNVVDKRRYEVLVRAVNGLGAISKWSAAYFDASGKPDKVWRAVSRGYADTSSSLASGLYNEAGTLLHAATRSYNLWRIELATGALTFVGNFDVYGSTAQATALADALNATASTYAVVVATQDEPFYNRTEGALPAAMYRCGASRNVFGSTAFKARSAYILVGRAGCLEGNGYEAYSGLVDDSTNAFCDLTFSLRAGNISVTSARNVLTNKLFGNIIDSSSWVYGSTGSQPGFKKNGSDAENLIVLSDAPDGVTRLIWSSVAGAGGSGFGADDGGWDGLEFPIDHTRMYRFSVWIRCLADMSGSYFFGCLPYSVNSIPGGPHGNPYFLNGARSGLTAGRWYLLTGFVLPSNFSGAQPNLGGLYDGVTGYRIASATDFRWVAGQTLSNHRAYQYYAANGSRQDFWGPRVDLCDGTEPSVKDLLALVGTQQLAIDAVTTQPLEATFAGPTEPLSGTLYAGVVFTPQFVSKVKVRIALELQATNAAAVNVRTWLAIKFDGVDYELRSTLQRIGAGDTWKSIQVLEHTFDAVSAVSHTVGLKGYGLEAGGYMTANIANVSTSVVVTMR